MTSWPEYAQHDWEGAWINTLFRNESEYLSSSLIEYAVALSLGHFGPAPALGMVTFIDTTKVRHKRDPGRCYRKVGFKPVGYTKKHHHLVLQLLPAAMPAAQPVDQYEMAATF